MSSSITILSLATIRTTAMYISFSISKCGSPAKIAAFKFCQDQDQQLPVHLGYKRSSNGSRVNLQLLKSYKDANGHEK